MEFSRRDIFLRLDEWKIDETGQLSDYPLTIMTELIHPRPRISLRRNTHSIPNRSGENVDWSEKPLHRRTLFKEIVEGPFSIGVTIKRNDSSAQLFNNLLSPILEAAGGEALEEFVDQFSSQPLASALEVLGELGLENLEDESLKEIIAAGVVELDTEEDQIEQTIDVPLTTPIDIMNPKPDPHPERHDDYEDVLKQVGDTNGYVTLRYSIAER